MVLMDFLHKSGFRLILAGLAASLSPALAQTSGRFALAGSFTYSADQLHHGSTTFTVVDLEGSVTVSSSQGALFPEGRSFLNSCVGFSEQSEAGLDLRSYCTLTEAAEDGGDELFTVADRDEGDLGAANRGGTGHMDLVGGTGKYAHITGHCSYTTQYLDTSTAVTVVDCNWDKP